MDKTRLNIFSILLPGKPEETTTMTKIEIDTEKGWQDVEQQIMELETSEILSIYDMFESNPTVFSMVGNELMYRREHKTNLEHEGQIGEIEQRFR